MRRLSLVALLSLSFVTTGCGGGSVEPGQPPITHDLVFEGVLDSVPEILRLDSGTGRVSRVLPAGMVAMDPEPSPDGQWIAFVVADYGAASGDIFVVRRDGSGLRQVTFDAELDDQPAWSPDGRRLAFRSFRTGRDGDIWVVDANGANAVNLTPDPLPGITDERRPAWSPDGSRIAYASNAGGNMDIWTMAADGSDSRRVTNSMDYDTEPAWSPDGTRLVFRRSNAGGSDLYIVPAAGGAAVPLPLPGDQRQPVWAPDGARIVFVSQAGLTARPDIHSVRADGTEPEALVTDAVRGSVNPAFLVRR